jgi:hypothetical protein
MDTARLNVNDWDMNTWFLQLQHLINNVPAHFVYNADQMGHRKFSDAKQRLCVVPALVMKDAYYDVSRQGERQTLIACVGADGSYLKPTLIVTRSPENKER